MAEADIPKYRDMWNIYAQTSQEYLNIMALDPQGFEFHEPCFWNVSLQSLEMYCPELVDPLLKDTDNVLKAARLAMKDRTMGGFSDNIPYGVRIVDPPSNIRINVPDITVNHVGKLWAVEGTVRSCGPLESLIVKACYACDRGHEFLVTQKDSFTLRAPASCPVCLENDAKHPSHNMTLVPEKSICRDIRLFDLQDQEGGLADTSIIIMALDDLAVKVKTGHHIRVTGVIKLQQKEEKKNKASLPRYIEANNIEWQQVDYERLQLTDLEELEIKNLASSPDVWDRLAQSIAPSILGMIDVKRAIVLQMFSIAEKPNDIRRTVHILLFGERGSGKSEIMSDARHIVGRGVMASGKNATVAGITAGAEKDERLGGRMVVRPGAIVLSDGGLMVLDEMEKMSLDVQDALHTAMEQQIVHKVAAGINMDMDCACAVLAAANPIGSVFTDNMAVAEQTKLDGALLERFDLVYICRAHQNVDVRKRVKEHIASGYIEAKRSVISKRPVDVDLFRKYLLYSKKMCPNPVLSKEAKEIITKADDQAKARCAQSGWPYGYRQFHAHLRLALASARMRLSPVIEAVDAENAVSCFNAFLDGVSGQGEPDLAVVYGNRSKTSAEKVDWVLEMVHNLTRDGGPVDRETLVELGMEAKVFRDAVEARRYIHRMADRDNLLYEPKGPGTGYMAVPKKVI